VIAIVTGAMAILITAFEFQNVLARWRGRTITPSGAPSDEFTIVIPLYGDPKYFEGRHELARYRRNVLVALEVTPERMTAFADDLEQEGWRVLRLRLPQPNPAELMKCALEHVTTPVAIRLDADTIVAGDLRRGVAAMLADGADLCSVKVEVLAPRSICQKVQAVEYRMAMLARHFRPWLTSGACLVGRTEALRRVYAHHALWTPGEDIETGRTAHALRMRVRHLDVVVLTEAPERFRQLFRQRRLWWAGSFRHWAINFDRNLLHLPLFTLYTVVAIWTSVFYRWWGMVDWSSLPRELPLIMAVYLLVTLISNWQVRSWWMLAMPLYAGVQGLVLPPLGAITYARLAWRRRRLGRYRFSYRRSKREPLPPLPRRRAPASPPAPPTRPPLPIPEPPSSTAEALVQTVIVGAVALGVARLGRRVLSTAN
jgi:cellulose synthase/poly-beta-1,6-N-acetylglucosamine synthase-like glycosyltransferase